MHDTITIEFLIPASMQSFSPPPGKEGLGEVLLEKLSSTHILQKGI